jgi:acyl-coenzyme A thioesterase PaaI-like protein
MKNLNGYPCEPVKDDTSFVSGRLNPTGLRMVFQQKGTKVCSEFTPERKHVSWAGWFHGGLMTAILDEAVVWALYCSGAKGITARMEIRLRRPVAVGQKFRVIGEITKRTRKTATGRSTAVLESGEVAAELEVTLFLLSA